VAKIQKNTHVNVE